MIDGRWKLAILSRLYEAPVLRFSELEHDIGEISQKVLTQNLRELERDGLVTRIVHAEVPPRVDYRLTPSGLTLRPALQALLAWGVARWRDQTGS